MYLYFFSSGTNVRRFVQGRRNGPGVKRGGEGGDSSNVKPYICISQPVDDQTCPQIPTEAPTSGALSSPLPTNLIFVPRTLAYTGRSTTLPININCYLPVQDTMNMGHPVTRAGGIKCDTRMHSIQELSQHVNVL